jgi:NADH oxidase (H2O2-forming)
VRIVVVGNGIAGYTALETIKSLKPSIDVSIVSDENAPLYSPCIFGNYLSGDLKRENLFLKNHSDYQRSGIKAILGQKVTEIDPHDKLVHLLHNKPLPYDKLILATGSEPIFPSINTNQDPRITVLKSIYDVDRIQSILDGSQTKNVIIIGSGPIGLEIAISLRKCGHSVTIIELLERIMPKLLDKNPASLLKSYLKENGVRLITGEKMMKISCDSRGLSVFTNKNEFFCDLVCICIGMQPRVKLAHDAGLELGSRGGIRVNSNMLTSNPNIHACGDCVETLDFLTGERCLSLLWHTAKLQAFIAGKSCLGFPSRYNGSVNFVVLEVFGKKVVSSGHVSSDFIGSSPQIFENDQLDGHLSLIKVNEKLVALQFFGSRLPKDLGRLISIIKRQFNKELKVQAANFINLPYY